MVKNLIFVMLGGGIGAGLRYVFSLLFCSSNTFPWQTFGANVIGSFIIGILYALLAQQKPFYSFAVIGILGGFTTFSSFSLENMKLIEAGKGELAILYTLSSLLIGVLACFIGYWISKNYF